MNVNCVNILGRSLNITNMNLLIRFNKTKEKFPSVTRVLSILLTTSAISASVERTNFKERVAQCLATSDRKPEVSGLSSAASYAQRSALCSNNLSNV